MKLLRYIFGTLYLIGAVTNTTLVAINGTESYIKFADASFFSWYHEAWMNIAAPNITLIVVLLIIFEVGLGLLFILNRRYLKPALVLGILFCLFSMPVMTQAIITNLPLALIQGYMLWREFNPRMPAEAAVKK